MPRCRFDLAVAPSAVQRTTITTAVLPASAWAHCILHTVDSLITALIHATPIVWDLSLAPSSIPAKPCSRPTTRSTSSRCCSPWCARCSTPAQVSVFLPLAPGQGPVRYSVCVCAGVCQSARACVCVCLCACVCARANRVHTCPETGACFGSLPCLPHMAGCPTLLCAWPMGQAG